MKQLLRLVFISALLILFCLPVCANNTVRILIEGEIMQFDDASPYFDESAGRIYVPVRNFTEQLGGKVQYDADTQKVTISTDTITIVLTIGETVADVNGASVTLDAPAFIRDGSTYVPLRFVAENLVFDVSYDAATSTASLTNKKMADLDMSETEIKTIYESIVYV